MARVCAKSTAALRSAVIPEFMSPGVKIFNVLTFQIILPSVKLIARTVMSFMILG